MRVCSKCKIEKPMDCFGKAAKHKCGYRYDCKTCQAEYRKIHFQKNREKQLAQGQKWKDDNREKTLEYAKQYAKEHKAQRCAAEMRRHATKVSTEFLKGEEWNDFFIQEIYDLSRLRTVETELNWEVDHIVPLQGKFVTGFHVWYNLQLLPASINRRKRNSF